MSRALSDRTTAGTAVTVAAQAGFDVDIGSMLAGNTIDLTYTEQPGGVQRTVTFMRVDDTSVLPLSDAATPNASDRVVGLDFSGGIASVVAQINMALGPSGLQFTNPSGTTLRMLDDGAGNGVDADALSVTKTTTSLTGGAGPLPFFLDGPQPFSGAITALGNQSLGYAGRITVNAALLADPTRLVVYQSGTPAGDATRPYFILDRLTTGMLDYAPQAGIGNESAPFRGSLQSYIRQMISQQGEAAASALSVQQGQEIVVNSLQQRYADQSNVNIDEEMANLMKLQTAYSANARVMSTVRDMIEQLFQL
jgi:flagellar hook-associated protein 1 FlgK